MSNLAEATAAPLHRARDSQGFPALHDDCAEAGEVGGAARRDVETRIGQPVVSSSNSQQLPATPAGTPEPASATALCRRAA
ncbi:MAG: hypothetical protein ABI068_17340 [Ktedonobacterales bacterium]